MDLVTSFRELFEIKLADSQELKEQAYTIRYEVYCEELGWEDKENFPNGKEIDAYDRVSTHCLIRHRHSGIYAGTVRMISTAPDSLRPPLPMIGHCPELYPGPYHPENQPPGSFGEISRLAVRRVFRRRAGEQLSADGVGPGMFQWHQDKRRRFPYISLGLYLAVSAVGLAGGLNNVYAIMEPRLARHLRLFGNVFERIGDPIYLKGNRVPFYIPVEQQYKSLRQPLQELLVAIAEDMNLEIARYP